MLKISPLRKRLLLSSILATSNVIASFCMTQTASATDLDAVMARLERLETDNKRMASEIATLKQKNHLLEGDRQSKAIAVSQTHPKSFRHKEDTLPTIPVANISSIEADAKSKWNGFYGGLNAGYAWGITNKTTAASTPLYDTLGPNSGSVYSGIFPVTSVQSSPLLGAGALANSGNMSIKKDGIIGGLQAGYNYLFSSAYLAGIETDIQGTSITGTDNYTGGPVTQYLAYSYDDGTVNHGQGQRTNKNIFMGNGSTTSNVSWLGTTRGRLGWLALENFLLFATGGLAYGGVNATSYNNALLDQTYTNTINGSTSGPINAQTFSTNSYSKYSAIKVGYVAGLGLEWMFSQYWSLKSECIYYNLGTTTFTGSPIAFGHGPNTSIDEYIGFSGVSASQPKTTVTFDGIIARVGLNYHFTSSGVPIIKKL
jgi:outer membrane immunogenic protein